MQDPLHRLYKTKLTLLATIMAVLGIALLFLAAWASGQHNWLASLPVTEIGGTLFASGLIVIAFEYVERQDADHRADQRLRRLLKEQAPAFRDAVIEGFALKPDELAKVASSETLDRLVQNGLSIRLGDGDLASDIYADLRQQVLRAPQRYYDTHISIALSPWEHGPTAGAGAMFVATIRWEYRVTPLAPLMRFACVSDPEEYRELLQDPASTVSCYFEAIGSLDASSPDAFQLTEFTVDGKPRTVRHSTRQRSQLYSVNLSKEAAAAGDRPMTVAFTYRALVQRHGHLLHLDIARPTKGLKVHFAYGGCGIRYVNLLDYIASSLPTRISRRPATDPAPAIEVDFDGWVLPKAGVAFVWVLEEEVRRPGQPSGTQVLAE